MAPTVDTRPLVTLDVQMKFNLTVGGCTDVVFTPPKATELSPTRL